MKWKVAAWDPKLVMPAVWVDLQWDEKLEWEDPAEPFQVIHCDSEALAAQVRDALNGVSAPESVQSDGYDLGMCSTDFTTSDQATIPGIDDPFDGVAVRSIPGDLDSLLALWAADITDAQSARHERGLRPREVRAINAGLGEQRTVYGIVSVLRDGLSSPKATRSLIEARLGRIDADNEAAVEAGDKRLARVHAVRGFTVRMLLIELRIAQAGGGYAVGIPVT